MSRFPLIALVLVLLGCASAATTPEPDASKTPGLEVVTPRLLQVRGYDLIRFPDMVRALLESNQFWPPDAKLKVTLTSGAYALPQSMSTPQAADPTQIAWFDAAWTLTDREGKVLGSGRVSAEGPEPRSSRSIERDGLLVVEDAVAKIRTSVDRKLDES